MILILGGKISAKFRELLEGTFSKMMSGDHDLIEVIKANAASNAPIHQMYRRALAQEPAAELGIPSSKEICKKRHFEREDAIFEMEMAERKQNLMQLTSESQMKAADAQMKVADAQMKVMGVQKMLMESYALLCPNQVMDDRARLLFKDNLLNIATSSTSSPARMQAAIGDGSATNSAVSVLCVGSAVVNPSNAVNPNKFITISTLAAEMGHRFNGEALKKIGKKVAAAYREKYNEEPGKHEQLVGGAARPVCSYTERDRAMVEKAIVDFLAERDHQKAQE